MKGKISFLKQIRGDKLLLTKSEKTWMKRTIFFSVSFILWLILLINAEQKKQIYGLVGMALCFATMYSLSNWSIAQDSKFEYRKKCLGNDIEEHF